MVGIQGSTYNVSVCRNYFVLNVPSKKVDDDGRLGQPWGIAFGKVGMWAVADHSKHFVYILNFDIHDQVVRKIGSKGKGNGEFDSPAGLAFYTDNNLYVVCRYNHWVQKLKINRQFLLQFGNKGKGNGELNCPLGIAVYNKRVYVADQCNHCISVFQCDGNFGQTIVNQENCIVRIM